MTRFRIFISKISIKKSHRGDLLGQMNGRVVLQRRLWRPPSVCVLFTGSSMNEPSKATQWTSRYPHPSPREWMNPFKQKSPDNGFNGLFDLKCIVLSVGVQHTRHLIEKWPPGGVGWHSRHRHVICWFSETQDNETPNRNDGPPVDSVAVVARTWHLSVAEF